MAKKTESNIKAAAGSRPGTDTPKAGPIVPLVAPVVVDDLDDRRLFELYCARVMTIDRYHVPITDKGFPSALRKAYAEAVEARRVFNECKNERS